MAKKTYLSVAETAQMLRVALKSAFPGVVFSVRSKSYSGGASINVSWTDGPTDADVSRVTSLYAGASFDGMVDLKSYHDSIVMGADGPKVVHFGADFVFTQRRLSTELLSRVYARACRKYGVEMRTDAVRASSWGAELVPEIARVRPWTNSNDDLSDLVYRMARNSVVLDGLLMELKGGAR